MKYYIIAGEASGDLHGASLMQQLIKIDKNAEFRFWGGELMLRFSKNIVKHYREMAYMGFIDVLKNISKIKQNLSLCKKDIITYKPDTVIFIDYPGFNLRIAEFVKEQNIYTIYYISPKIWAWKKNRAFKIKKYIDKMFVIFPFEKEFYQQFDYQVEYMGNPNIDIVNKKKKEKVGRQIFLTGNNIATNKPIIAMLAGSRKQEIKRILPHMLAVTKKFPDYNFVIAGLSSLDYTNIFCNSQYNNVTLIYDQTYQLLMHSQAALVTSGTATLETALFFVPQLVCYKTEYFFFWLAKYFVKIKFISLVNILLQREAIKEIIQTNITSRMTAELSNILNDENYRTKMLLDYKILQDILGDKNSVYRTAENIYHQLSKL